MADENKEAAAEPVESGKSRNLLENKVVLLGAIVILQAIMAIAVTQLVIVPKLGVQAAGVNGEDSGEGIDPLADLGIIVGLEEIIVTLQSKGKAANYLRINVNLEVDSQETADQVVARLPQLRDIVIVILSSQSAQELSSPDGTQALRAEIFRRLAEKLPPETLKNIYFSDLVIQ
jgi:flagellar FliL protein